LRFAIRQAAWSLKMRKNLPVITVGYPISDDTLIASRTDAAGRPVSTISSSSPLDSLTPN
jgi:hypothetical protein